ncbi:MAG: PhnD/SsuA/transferrin family substrate-binding protein [Planctomycetes bacterium]|nr:PhnD/SsuA/transferrin family substrate-binding protein [Planctomycetota bacterium]
MLRAVTYLAPGLPKRLFELVTEALARTLGRAWNLTSLTQSSGPMHEHDDPFRGASMDLGFVCAPSYLYLSSAFEPSVDLVPRGFVFDDVRIDGRPRYYSELVVRAESDAHALEDLHGAVWGYNDECSLSGYFATKQHLQERGLEALFARQVCTGSHAASLEAIRTGAIDCAAIDSNVLALARREDPTWGTRLRCIVSLGPFPIQPIIVRRAPDLPTAVEIADALDTLCSHPGTRDQFAECGVRGFAAVAESDYEAERCALTRLGSLPSSDSRNALPEQGS